MVSALVSKRTWDQQNQLSLGPCCRALFYHPLKTNVNDCCSSKLLRRTSVLWNSENLWNSPGFRTITLSPPPPLVISEALLTLHFVDICLFTRTPKSATCECDQQVVANKCIMQLHMQRSLDRLWNIYRLASASCVEWPPDVLMLVITLPTSPSLLSTVVFFPSALLRPDSCALARRRQAHSCPV